MFKKALSIRQNILGKEHHLTVYASKARAILVVSRESQMAILEDYTDMFEPFEANGALGIRLREGIETIELWKRFCASLSIKVLHAFQAEEAKQVLGDIAAKALIESF